MMKRVLLALVAVLLILGGCQSEEEKRDEAILDEIKATMEEARSPEAKEYVIVLFYE